MRQGEVWTVSGGKDYAGKPRPVVIVQDDIASRWSQLAALEQYRQQFDPREPRKWPSAQTEVVQ